MQVHPSTQQHGFHGHPSNGVHGTPDSRHPMSSNGGHIHSDEMHPYQHQQQQHYGGGYTQQQQASHHPQHRQQYQTAQGPTYLPPMQSHQAMSAPSMHSMPLAPPSTVPSTMYMGAQHAPALHSSGAGVHAPERAVQLTHSSRDSKYEYSLVVEQQPQRARMCGFGDKDRRPITPPPCIRLVIKDIKTNQEVDISDIDGSFFVLQVDIWADDGTREVNLVRASSSSPAVSISTASTTSFPPTPERPMLDPSQTMQMHYGQDGQPVYGYIQPGYPRPMMPHYGPASYYPQPGYPGGYVPQSQAANTMYTRNLIGSLTVNASRLHDTENKDSYWFVLQDLSVRTEGFFRLKMNFIDVGSQMGGSALNKGKAPVLAWVFSDKFQVYSAKKFPGVIESTALSKCFATQGIKIPIRKDTKAENDGADDD